MFNSVSSIIIRNSTTRTIYIKVFVVKKIFDTDTCNQKIKCKKYKKILYQQLNIILS